MNSVVISAGMEKLPNTWFWNTYDAHLFEYQLVELLGHRIYASWLCNLIAA